MVCMLGSGNSSGDMARILNTKKAKRGESATAAPSQTSGQRWWRRPGTRPAKIDPAVGLLAASTG